MGGFKYGTGLRYLNAHWRAGAVSVQCSKLAKMREREKVGTETGEQPVCYCKILSCFELRLPLPSLQDHLPPLPCPPTHSQAPM